jgi:hypothetical protein
MRNSCAGLWSTNLSDIASLKMPLKCQHTLWRHRGHLVAEASSTIQRVQKVWPEMNVQLRNVLSDLRVSGGMNLMGAIWEGEHDP